MSVTFSKLAAGEVYFRKAGVCLYAKQDTDGALTHTHGRNPAGGRFYQTPSAVVAIPKWGVMDKRIVAIHPDNGIVRDAGPAAPTAPDTDTLMVAHLPVGSRYYGYGPYGSTDWYVVNESIPGAGLVNVAHCSTGKQLLGNPGTLVQRYVPAPGTAFLDTPTPETSVTDKDITIETVKAPVPTTFVIQPGERLRGKHTGTEFLVYTGAIGDLRLMNMKTAKDGGATPSAVYHNDYERLTRGAPDSPAAAYAPKVGDLVLYEGKLYKVTWVYTTRDAVDLIGMFGADSKGSVSTAKLSKVIKATVHVTH